MQIDDYINRHGNTLLLAGGPYTVIRVDKSAPQPTLLIQRGQQALRGLLMGARRGREIWQIVSASGRRQRRIATFEVSADGIRTLVA